MANADEDALRATSIDVADESEYIQELRKELMETDLTELKTNVLASIKREQPDVELPSGGKEEIVAWVVEWENKKEEREEEAERAKEEEKRVEEEQLEAPAATLAAAPAAHEREETEREKEEVEESGDGSGSSGWETVDEEEEEEEDKEEEEEKKRVEEERAAHAREEARLLIVEPRKDTPGQLHAYLIANPSAVPAFKLVATDATNAAWLGEAVKATPALAELTDADGRHAFAFAHLRCKQACEHYPNLRRYRARGLLPNTHTQP